MTAQQAAAIVRAVENVVGLSGETISLDDTCDTCTPSVLVLCGPPEQRVALSFSNLRGLSVRVEAEAEDAKLLRAELDRDHDVPIHADEQSSFGSCRALSQD